MKKLLSAILVLAVSAGLFSFAPKKHFMDSLNVDVKKSKIDWYGAAADHYHPGVVMLKSGTVMTDNGKITGGRFVIDLTTVKSTDDAGDRLDNTLKSPNFFNVAQFGEATYDIVSVNYTSENTADITGNLSVKGASVPVKFQARIRGLKDGKLFADAFFNLDLSSIGVKYGADIAVHLFATK